MARRRTRRVRDEDKYADDAPSPRKRRAPPRRWGRRLVLLSILVGGLLAAAPTLLSRSAVVRQFVLARALPREAGRLTCDSAEFGWLSDQRLAGVKVIDANGEPLAEIATVASDRSLLSLATNRSQLGTVRIEQPVLHVQTRPGGSNIEDFVAALATPTDSNPGGDSPSADQSPRIAIEVVDGVVQGYDTATGRRWQLAQFQLAAGRSGDAEAWQGSGSALLSAESPAVAPGALVPSRGEVKFRVQQAGDGVVQIELLANRAPLAPLEGWLTRWAPGCRLSGETSADARLAIRPAPPGPAVVGPASLPPQSSEIRAAGKLDLVDCWFTSDALGGDTLHTAAAALEFDLAAANSRVAITKLAGKGDWFELSADGQANLGALAAAGTQALPDADARARAQFDVARLAAMLPRTLGLRDGVRIDAGVAAIEAASVLEHDARKWTLVAAMQDLAGSDGKREIRWNQPIRVEASLVDSSQGPTLEKALVQSNFAAATLVTAPAGFDGKATFDLAQLAIDLGQFVDLSQWQLAGTGRGQFIIRDLGDGEFETKFDADLAGVRVGRDGKLLYADPEVKLAGEATGKRQGMQLVRLASATATLRGPSETLEAKLLAPAEWTDPAGPQWHVQAAGNGPLAAWVGRLRPWTSLPGEFAGQATIGGEMRLGPPGIAVNRLKFTVNNLQGRIGDTTIAEPRLEASGEIAWDRATGAIAAPKLLLASSTLAVQMQNLALRWDEAASTSLTGTAAFRADLERLATWLGLASGPGAVWPKGEAVGQIQLASNAAATTAELTITAEPLELLRAGDAAPGRTAGTTSLWQEPQLRVAVAAAYDRAADRLQLANLQVEGRTVQLAGTAAIDRLRTTGALSGDVNVTYDANQLARLLTAYVGPGMRIDGANQARLQLAGSLAGPVAAADSAGPPTQLASTVATPWARRWQAKVETGWSAANFYGLPLSAAQITGTLADGQVLVSPIDVAVGQGRLTLSPRLALDPPPKVLTFAPGPIAARVAVSAEVSDAMLKYFVPMVADAVRSAGTFSMDSQGILVPVDNPRMTDATGRLVIHQLDIGPGPMLADVVRIVSQLEAVSRGQTPPTGAPDKLLSMKEQTIEYRVVEGRVYHRGLEFFIDDVPVRSYGSVGFDETLSIRLQVPVQQKWLGRERALQNLAGQIIEIPIEGTFSRPRVEDRAVANLTRQLLQGAASQAIGDELNRALDKLFRKN